MFQSFALGIERLLGRWRNRNVISLGKNRAKCLQNIRSRKDQRVIQIKGLAAMPRDAIVPSPKFGSESC
jgi:hypothetical protein